MASESSSGKPRGAYVVTDADLKSAVGGTYVVQPGPAIPVTGFATGTRGVTGGKPMAVYVVNQAEAERRGLMGGKPLPIADITSSDRGTEGPHIAIPVYIVSGSEYIGGGSAPTPTPPAPTYVNYSAFTPAEPTVLLSALTPTIWTVPTGMKAGLRQDNAGIYPFPITEEAGVIWDTPVAIVGNDMWIQWKQIGTYTGAADYIGGCVRMASGAETFYAFMYDNNDYILTKASAGSYTNLKTGAITPAQGLVWRLEVVGTTISVYRDDVLFDSATDGDISSGGIGLTARGSSVLNSISDIRGGNLPVGDTAVWNTGYYMQFHLQDGANIVTDTCGFSSDAALADGIVSAGTSHAVDHMHYIELDFGRFVVPSRLSSHGTTSDIYDWTDIDVKTKLEAADEWTEVATALTLDNEGIDGWKESGDFSTITHCRYMRIEINATLNASNTAGSEELRFLCN